MVLARLTRFWLLLTFILVIASNVFPQTGPGGVGTTSGSSSLVVWYKADAGTSATVNASANSSWADQSGNSNDASVLAGQTAPTFTSSSSNGFPGLVFNGANQLQFNRTISTNMTIISVFKSTQNNSPCGTNHWYCGRGIVDAEVNGVTNDFGTSFKGGKFFTGAGGTSDNSVASAASYADGRCHIGVMTRSQSSGAIDQYVDETHTATVGSTSNLLTPSRIVIGSLQTNINYFTGNINEVMCFSSVLNTAQRLILENYLASKYDITLAASDLYNGDSPVNGNYDRFVAGIGQFSITENQVSYFPSAGGGLGMTNVSGLDDGDYALSGYSLVANSLNSLDVGGMTGTNNQRWGRDFYIDVTNSAGSMVNNIFFDASDAGLGTPTFSIAANYVLLYRSGLTGNWTELTTASSVSGDQVFFNNITLANDGYYTLGTKNSINSPLPIELKDFTGSCADKEVQLKWTTAREVNNSHYLVEKSSTGEHWALVARVNGKGTTAVQNTYACSNHLNTGEPMYYKLTQVDYNGSRKAFDILVLDCEENATEDMILFPNPASAELNLRLTVYNMSDNGFVRIIDACEKMIKEIPLNLVKGTHTYTVALNDVPDGFYYVSVASGNTLLQKRKLIVSR